MRVMTRLTKARIAGLTLLLYIAAGISNMILMGGATSGEGTAAKMARIAEHAADVRWSILLTLAESLSALLLGVLFYGLTREQDHELAMFGLVCRVCEGVLGATTIPKAAGLLGLAASGDPNGLGAFLLMPGPSVPAAAIFWAAGSTVFSYLMARGRMVPGVIAWLGVFSSALLVVCLPLQLVGWLAGPVTGYMWLPALVFEVTLGPWLIVKGCARLAA